MNRREFIKATSAATLSAAALSASGAEAKMASPITRQAPVVGCENVTGRKVRGTRAKVYFTRTISAESLIALYDRISESIHGKVAVKLHTGERHGPNIIPPAMAKPLLEHIPESVIVETNTMYDGDRYTTAAHRKTLKINGWTFCPVDILDEEGDERFPVRKGLHLKDVAVGAHLANYDSLVVLTHFKGHTMGGFGGSLKNIAIGCASGQGGKRQVHGYPVGDIPPTDADWGKMRSTWGTDSDFAELNRYMDKIKTQLIDRGVPVIIGEYGCPMNNKDPESVQLFLTSVCRAAYERGICPILWDVTGSHYDRVNCRMYDQELMDSLLSVQETPSAP